MAKKETALPKHYGVLTRPVFSEKASASLEAQKSVVGFIVDKRATKTEIKDAVEKIFNVSVERVRTMNYLGKPKRTTTIVGRRASFKKALVTLKEGDKIQLIEGL